MRRRITSVMALLGIGLFVLGGLGDNPGAAQSQPVLQVSPDHLEFQIFPGREPRPQRITLINDGGGLLHWTASADASWITLGGTEGTLSPRQVITMLVLVDPQGLSAGEHQGTITIEAPGVQGSPAQVVVTLKVPGITLTNVLTLTGHTGWVRSVAFRPGGMILASGSSDHNVKLWQIATGEERTLKGHAGLVSAVAFSPDGTLLASSSFDKTIKLWQVSTGQLLRTLTGHSDAVKTVAFQPDGRFLASGSKDKMIKLWEVDTGQEILTMKGHTGGVESVTFSFDGGILASGSRDQTIKLWPLNLGKP